MDMTYYLFAILGFLSVALFLEGAYLAWNAYRGPEASRIERRLASLTSEGRGPARPAKPSLLTELPSKSDLLKMLPKAEQVDQLLRQAGLTWKLQDFFVLTLVCIAVAIVATVLLAAPLAVTVGAAVVAGLLPLWRVRRVRRLRLTHIERVLPDAMDLMARAMVAGHAFPSAVKMVADEMPGPVSEEFRIVFDEINYGIDVPEALTNLVKRVPSDDLRYFVISVLIQRETGGNLGELLGTLSALIRARLKLLGTVRVLSAEGRLSAIILVILPFVLAAVLNLVNPGFLSVLWTDEVGKYVVAGALGAMAVGVLWIRKIVRIHV